MNILKHIFDPFFTTKETGWEQTGSHGCIFFVKEHGGTITAENTDEGVCFRILLLYKPEPVIFLPAGSIGS